MNINPDSAKEISCKNELIYGFCKFEDKGCVFLHSALEKLKSHDSVDAVSPPSSKSRNSTDRLKSATANTEMLNDTSPSNVTSPSPASKMAASAQPEFKRKYNLNTPSFQPSVSSVTNKFAALSPKVKEIPVFVPSGVESSIPINTGQETSVDTPAVHHSSFAARKFNTSTPSFTPSSPFEAAFSFSSSNQNNTDGFVSQFSQMSSSNNTSAYPGSPQAPQQAGQPPKQQNPYLSASGPTVAASSVNSQSLNSSDFMFQSQNAQSYPLNHHLYAPAPPPRLVAPSKSHETNANAMFIPNNLRESLTKKNEATLQTMSRSNLPDHVGIYHSLVPIDTSFEQLSSTYDLPSYLYKVLSNYDGLPYALRRIDQSTKLKILNETPFANVKKWKALQCPNVVCLRDAFTSISLSTNGEPSLFLAYDYFPLASTLQEQHITRRLGGKLEPVTEDLLWTYLVQLTSALVTIHESGLYAGSSLELSKVLVTNKNRVRLGAVGVDDILNCEELEKLRQESGEEKATSILQSRDFAKLSKLMTDLASTVLPISLRGSQFQPLLAHLQKSSIMTMSSAMVDAMTALHEADETFDLVEFYSKHLSRASMKCLNGLQDSTDFLEGQLLSEVENGRLFRLLAKINSVLDRPENDGDKSGHTFIIKSFRDFLFQSVDENDKPAIDLSNILVNLNKLDVGVDEKLLLISREDDSCIIVSYKEIKDSLDSSFRALIR